MTHKLLLLLMLLISIFGCELEHSNPLDPAGSNETVPPVVTEISLRAAVDIANNRFVEISWNDNLGEISDDIAGYKIYRSLSYSGDYVEISNPSSSPEQDFEIIPGNRYYYKLSSVNNHGLEGYLSAPKSITIQ